MPFLEIAKDYDAFLLDLWGVIHDGSAMYAGVARVLGELNAQGKQIIFLSNAPRRAVKVKRVLDGFGIKEGTYLDVVTSGEAGHLWLAREGDRKQKYFFMGSVRDIDVMDGLDYARADSLDEADFIVNVGFATEKNELPLTQEAIKTLPSARSRGLPMLCLNPDMEVVKITGERFACAGVIAKAYADIGGKVHWFGKPHEAVYAHCFSLLPGVPKHKILAVGDSLETDITGAKSAGLDSLLITGGILRHCEAGQIANMCDIQGLTPKFILPQMG